MQTFQPEAKSTTTMTTHLTDTQHNQGHNLHHLQP